MTTFLTLYIRINTVFGYRLDQCVSELRFGDIKTNVPDLKMYQETYDALFYGSCPYRLKMSI